MCQLIYFVYYKIVFITIHLSFFLISFLETTLAENNPKVRLFEFTYIAEVNNIPTDVKKVSIWLPYPKSEANQEITPLRISTPYPANIYKDPKDKNYILYLSITNHENRTIKVEMKFRVRRCENIRRNFNKEHVQTSNDFDHMLKRWLQPDRLVPIDGRIKKLAEEVTRDKTTDLEKARAIYDYVIANLTYNKSGIGWGRGDICYACDVRHGNCTDFHSLVIGLCKAVCIPAKFAIGFPLRPQSMVRVKSWLSLLG